MKKISKLKPSLKIISFFTILFLGCVNSVPSQAESINWYSYNEGVEKARQQRKPVVIDFFASWCHWCKVMDKKTFSDEKVAGKMNSDYIAVRIDMESREKIRVKGRIYSADEFASMMGVQGLPSTAFLDKDGEPVTIIPGYLELKVFLPILDYMKNECYKQKISLKDYLEKKAECGN